jgi:hypothetical protein
MSEWKPTGRTRYRLHRTLWSDPILVLQIEVRGIETDMIGGWIDSKTVNRWRDASVSDLPTLPAEVAA